MNKLVAISAALAVMAAAPCATAKSPRYLHLRDARAAAARLGHANKSDVGAERTGVGRCYRHSYRFLVCEVIYYGVHRGLDDVADWTDIRLTRGEITAKSRSFVD